MSFDPETERDQLSPALNLYQYQLKGVSFLPRIKLGAYPQMPYEAVSEAVYKEHMARISSPKAHARILGTALSGADPSAERFCDSSQCNL